MLSLAQAYAALGNVPKLEAALEKLTKVMPNSPEAWYDLAVLKAGIGKPAEALAALRQALDLSAKRLQRDPKARDLLASARKEERFGAAAAATRVSEAGAAVMAARRRYFRW